MAGENQSLLEEGGSAKKSRPKNLTFWQRQKLASSNFGGNMWNVFYTLFPICTSCRSWLKFGLGRERQDTDFERSIFDANLGQSLATRAPIATKLSEAGEIVVV